MTIEDVLAQLDDLERAMKAPPFEATLNRQNLNLSFALLAVEGLRAYLQGDITEAQDTFATLTDELSLRRQPEIARTD
jgi:hypothetical protein